MAKTVSLDKSLWLSWILVTCIGSVSGFILGGSLGDLFEDDYLPLFILMLNLCCGLLIGLGQWIILRTRLKKVWMWIPATTIGLPLGFTIGFFIGEIYIGSNIYKELVYFLILPIVAGIVTGVLQWLVLRRRLRDASKWILISGLSWGIAVPVSLAINLDSGNWVLRNSATGAIMGIIVGAISGTFIKSLVSARELEGNDS